MDVTPLMSAVRCGDLEVTRELLKSGADPTKQSPFGIDLLVLACAGGNMDIVQVIYQELEKVGADEPPDLGLAVRTAVLFGHEPVVDFLIKQKCDLKAADKDSGVTALMLAVCNGSTRMVSLLLSHGVDPHIRNELGQTALDVATVRKCQHIIPFLQRSNTPLARRRRKCDVSVLGLKIPLITFTEGPAKTSTPTNRVGPEAFEFLASPVSPIERDVTNRFPATPQKLQDNFLYPSSQVTAHRRSNSGSFKRLKTDSMGSKGDTSEFGNESGSPQYYTDQQSRRNLTFSEKIELLDKLESNSVQERNSKPLWRSWSDRLQVIRKRKRCGYLLSTSSRQDPGPALASVSHPGFCTRKRAKELDSHLKESEETGKGYDMVSAVLRINHLDQYIPLFKRHEIDLATLTSVTDGDLQEMGVHDSRHRRDVLWISHLLRSLNPP